MSWKGEDMDRKHLTSVITLGPENNKARGQGEIPNQARPWRPQDPSLAPQRPSALASTSEFLSTEPYSSHCQARYRQKRS